MRDLEDAIAAIGEIHDFLQRLYLMSIEPPPPGFDYQRIRNQMARDLRRLGWIRYHGRGGVGALDSPEGLEE